ncbi:SufE family protein [Pseudomonas sp. dw_358]|uniref:SufE family protein n=1 Tax=Pseudomonas sp. dw_358 TaxID=2720083 RepID=UPI001BD4A529|nr:SufE family protein [Pseudomonas sp. dw_358]
MSLSPAAQEALDTFTAAPGWEQRARFLMQWGERLMPLSDDERSDINRVHGCESVVWLVADQQGSHWRFRAASDARLIRGLLALLLARIEDASTEELKALDLADWFSQLGLGRQLSPSRSNGMNAVLGRIRSMTA